MTKETDTLRRIGTILDTQAETFSERVGLTVSINLGTSLVPTRLVVTDITGSLVRFEPADPQAATLIGPVAMLLAPAMIARLRLGSVVSLDLKLPPG